jgi:Zn-dependent protease
MGGLAIEGRPQGMFGSPWSLESYASFQPKARSPQEQILISAAGPAIQFLFAGLIVLAIYATGGRVIPSFHGFLPLFAPQLGEDLASNRNLALLAWYLLQVNTLWPLINLLPVLPLDGGQIAMQVLVQHDAWGGTQRALWLSVFTGGAIAVLSLLFLGEMFLGLLFASLAVSSYMALQQLGGGGRPW